MRSHGALWGVLLMLLCAAAAWPADISGQWKAEWAAGGGVSKQSIFTFKQDGTTLTGTIGGEGGELQISEGKVNGDDVAFVVARKIGSREATMTYTGRVSGSEIKFKVSFPGTERTWDMTATRVP